MYKWRMKIHVACRQYSPSRGGAGSVFPCDDNGSPMMWKSLFHTPKEAFQQDVKSRAEPWLVLIALMSSVLR